MTRTIHRPANTAAIVLLLITLLPLAGGCAFDRNWKRLSAAARQETEATTTTDPDKLAGRWEGTWQSERSNHSGKLRAIITPVNETTYRADFSATYLGLMRFGYSMNLAAQTEGDVIRFQGEEDLGWLAGGVYRYDGATDGQAFDCTYTSKGDDGTFRMTRPTR
jgi:hypothetical protein